MFFEKTEDQIKAARTRHNLLKLIVLAFWSPLAIWYAGGRFTGAVLVNFILWTVTYVIGPLFLSPLSQRLDQTFGMPSSVTTTLLIVIFILSTLAHSVYYTFFKY